MSDRHALRPRENADPSSPTPNPPTSGSEAYSGQDGPSEIERLTAALHAHCAHPDWLYVYTTGAIPNPPSTIHGEGWEENREDYRHGAGTPPTITWSWRRLKTPEETA